MAAPSAGQRLHSRGGLINRLTAFLLALIALMLVVIAIPSWERFSYRSQKTACQQAIKSAQDGLIIEYLSRYEEESADEARKTLDAVLPERPNICPSYGTIYLVRMENGIFEPVCGLHDSDIPRRTRLNASRAKELLEGGLEAARQRGETVGNLPLVEISLNGKTLTCLHVREEEPLYRGTKTTSGYEGTVAFYGLAGEGTFAQTAYPIAKVCYFLYADEDSCAVWRAGEGWSGLAYEQ